MAGAAAKVELAAAGAAVSGPKVSLAGSAMTEIKGTLAKSTEGTRGEEPSGGQCRLRDTKRAALSATAA